MKHFLLIVSCLACGFAFGQFAPPVGMAGTTAMFKDSSAFVAWGRQSHVTRGLQDVSTPSLGLTTVGDSSMVPGKADGAVVSLGDGGEAIVTFSTPISNGTGYDFAVFENSFNDTFLELAFVEVSSDGVNFVRFPATSNSPASPQYTNGAVMDATKIDNLAGKYRGLYGTPFDLQQLAGNAQLNINAVTHVKIIDVVGSINTTYARYDKNNNVINDPWPTPFASGGFDLDAVGVINQAAVGIKEIAAYDPARIYPNPFSDVLFIEQTTLSGSPMKVTIRNHLGQELYARELNAATDRILLSGLAPGIYYAEITDGTARKNYRLVKQ